MDNGNETPTSSGHPRQQHLHKLYVRYPGDERSPLKDEHCARSRHEYGGNTNEKRMVGDQNAEQYAYRRRSYSQSQRSATLADPSLNSQMETNADSYRKKRREFLRSQSEQPAVAGSSLNSCSQLQTSDIAVPYRNRANWGGFRAATGIQPTQFANAGLSFNSNLQRDANGHIFTPYLNSSTAKQPRVYHRYKQNTYKPYISQNNKNVFNKNHERNSYSSSIIKRNSKMPILHAPRLSEFSKNALRMAINNQPRARHVTQKTFSRQDTDCVSELSADCGDLNKLNKMTAIEFDRDRYARYGVHESEIKDEVRTKTFKTCIELCANKYIKDKVVLVIRCGIGFLPLLCVRFGFAKKVIGLEQSACIEYARRIVNDNFYSNQITLIQSSVQDLKELPHGLSQVDVIVSDCMGDCVLGQGDQMEQVIEARNRFLKPTGLMIPMKISLYAHLSEQRRAYENGRIRKKVKKLNQPITTDYESDSSTDSNYCSWWSNVYGFDLTSDPEFLIDENSENGELNHKWRIMAEPIASYFNSCRVVSSAGLIKTFNMLKCSIEDLRYVQSKNITLHCITPYTSSNGGEYGHMLEMFMVVDFPNGQNSVSVGFSTSSSSPFTRYKQTGLLLRDQLPVLEGDKFTINEFSMQRGPQNNKLKDDASSTISKNNIRKFEYEESLKLRLNYTFVNKYTKAIDRRCIYTITKYLF